MNPIWNEHFEFTVEDPLTQRLTVRVFDDEGVQASELIGCAQVALRDLEPGKVKDVWLKLVKDLEIQRDNKYRGQVRLLYSNNQTPYRLANFLPSLCTLIGFRCSWNSCTVHMAQTAALKILLILISS